MTTLYIIEIIAKLIICGLIPLCICLAGIFLLCKQDKHCSLDIETIESELRVHIWNICLVLLLWGLSYIIMNGVLYDKTVDIIQSLIDNAENNILQWVIKILPLSLLILYIACDLFLKITIYPDLAFRVVPGQAKKVRKKEFFQFETQFWNAGILPHHNLKTKLTKWTRNKHGNIESQNIPMHPIDDWCIKNIFYRQDDRAGNVSSCPDKWEKTGNAPVFEYLELTVSSEARLFNTNKNIELSETKRFYPLDIHQGDFKDVDEKKVVPQPLVTTCNNQVYISAKRIVQKWDEGLRVTQCVLLVCCIVLAIISACVHQCVIHESFILSLRIVIALFLITALWRVVLKIPIKAVAVPSYIYGSQQL